VRNRLGIELELKIAGNLNTLTGANLLAFSAILELKTADHLRYLRTKRQRPDVRGTFAALTAWVAIPSKKFAFCRIEY
jgi:hypothetical protein